MVIGCGLVAGVMAPDLDFVFVYLMVSPWARCSLAMVV